MKSLSKVDYFRKCGQELKKCELGDIDFVSVQLCSFVINNFLFFIFHTQHNIISKIQQNKTTDTYSTSQGPIKREGKREGQQEHKSHSFIQSRMSNKKHCQASMVEGLAPPTRAVVHSHDTICRRLQIHSFALLKYFTIIVRS